jgi:hypothetical protein
MVFWGLLLLVGLMLLARQDAIRAVSLVCCITHVHVLSWILLNYWPNKIHPRCNVLMPDKSVHGKLPINLGFHS